MTTKISAPKGVKWIKTIKKLNYKHKLRYDKNTIYSPISHTALCSMQGTRQRKEFHIAQYPVVKHGIATRTACARLGQGGSWREHQGGA